MTNSSRECEASIHGLDVTIGFEWDHLDDGPTIVSLHVGNEDISAWLNVFEYSCVEAVCEHMSELRYEARHNADDRFKEDV
jgi:hypothetical protein